MNILLQEKIRVPIPFMGIPLKYRINPISTLITRSKYNIVLVEHVSEESCKYNDFTEIVSIRKLLEYLSSEFGEEFKLRVLVDKECARISPTISLYSMASYIVGKLIADEYDVDVIDVFESFMGIESEIYGKEIPQFIQALRLTILNDKPLIYRYGEGIVLNDLPNNVYALLFAEPIQASITLHDEDLMDIITKLVGLNTIKAFNKQRIGDIKNLSENCRVENGIWYILYGYHAPRELPNNNHNKYMCIKPIIDIDSPKILVLSKEYMSNSISVLI